MAWEINTNVASLNAQNSLSTSQSSLTKTIQQLSSGLRINSAADDAVGFAVSNLMQAQVNGLQQASRNANDGINLAQTAQGAMSTIEGDLQSMRTLALQASNGTYSPQNYQTFQSQFQALNAQIQQVATTTQYNGSNLLDGTFTNKTFQVGANANQTISLSLSSMQTSALGATNAASLTASNDGTAMSGGDLTLNGVTVGPSLAASDTSSTAGNAASAIAKVAAINLVSSQTGVSAAVNTNIDTGAAQTLGAGSGTITVNGVTTGTVVLGGQNGTTDRGAIVNAINAISGQTGVQAVDSGLSVNGITLSAANGENITVALTSAGGSVFTSATTGLVQATAYGTYTLSSSSPIVVSGSATPLTDAGVTAGTYQTQTAYAATTAGAAQAFSAGDFTINGVQIGASLAAYDPYSTSNAADSAIAKAAAINAISSQTGVSAAANANTDSGTAQTLSAGSGTFTINGVTTATITQGGANITTDQAAVVNAINAISGRTGVYAVAGGSSAAGVSLVATNGRNIAIAATSSGGSVFTSASTGVTFANATVYGTFTLKSATAFTVASGPAPTSTLAADAMLAAGTYGNGMSGQALSMVNISTASGAEAAITAINNALNTLNSASGLAGSIQDQFTNVQVNLNSEATNLTQARGTIVNVDFAYASAQLAQDQVLQQAGTAMLAQANTSQNGVLALLR